MADDKDIGSDDVVYLNDGRDIDVDKIMDAPMNSEDLLRELDSLSDVFQDIQGGVDDEQKARDLSDRSRIFSENIHVRIQEGMADNPHVEDVPFILPKPSQDLLGKNSGVVVGALGYELMRANIEGHIVTIGKTGAGKGRAGIIPNLLAYEGSIVCLEADGTAYNATHKHRRALGQKMCIFDPMGISGQKSDSFNIFDAVDRENIKDVDLISLTSGLAKILLENPEGRESQDKYFEEQPANILQGLMIYLMMDPSVEKKDRNICRAIELSMSYGNEAWHGLMEKMSQYEGKCAPLVKRIGDYFKGERNSNKDSLSSSIASEGVKALIADEMKNILSTSTVDFKDLRDGNATVYILLRDTDNFKHLSGYVRHLLDASIKALNTAGDGGASYKNDRVLYLVDEFTNIGKLDSLVKGVKTARARGVTIWTFFQHYSDLKDLYGEDKAQTILHSASLVQLFDASEEFLQDFASRRAGNKLVAIPEVQHSFSTSDSDQKNFSVAQTLSGTATETQTTGISITDAYTRSIGDTDLYSLAKRQGTSGSWSKTGTTSTQISNTDTSGGGSNRSDTRGGGTSVPGGLGRYFAYLHYLDSDRQSNAYRGSQKGTSDFYSKSIQTAESKGESNSIGGVTSEDTSETYGRQHQRSTAIQKAITELEQISKSIALQRGRQQQVGISRGEQRGITYSVRISLTKMPVFDPPDVRGRLSPANAMLLLFNDKGNPHCYLVNTPNYDQIPALRIKAFGPGDEYMPVPQQPFVNIKKMDLDSKSLIDVARPSASQKVVLPKIPDIPNSLVKGYVGEDLSKTWPYRLALSRLNKNRMHAQQYMERVEFARELQGVVDQSLEPVEEGIKETHAYIMEWGKSLNKRLGTAKENAQSVSEYHDKLTRFKKIIDKAVKDQDIYEIVRSSYREQLVDVVEKKIDWPEYRAPTRPRRILCNSRSVKPNIGLDSILRERPNDLVYLEGISVPEYDPRPYRSGSKQPKDLDCINTIKLIDDMRSQGRLKGKKKNVFINEMSRYLDSANKETVDFIAAQMERKNTVGRLRTYVRRTLDRYAEFEHSIAQHEEKCKRDRAELDEAKAILVRFCRNVNLQIAEAHNTLEDDKLWKIIEGIEEEFNSEKKYTRRKSKC